MIESGSGRDLSGLVVPRAGGLVATGDEREPYRLIDPAGLVVEPVSIFLRELQAMGRSAATLRSYGMDLLRWWRFLDAVGVAWDRASRVEARDFSCWIGLTVKQRLQTSRPRAARWSSGVLGPPNPVTGKPGAGEGYAPASIAHSETVLRRFYDFHRDAGSGPIVNPFPLDLGRRSRWAHAHHNPMQPWRPERVGRYRPTVPRRVPRAIPDDRFNELFAALSSNRDRALVAFWISTGVRASELLGVRGCDVHPGEQLISVVRKGSRAVQQVPASADAFVWLRLYQRDLFGQGIPRGRRQPLWWTLRRPYRPLTYYAAHRMFERVNAALGADWTLHDLRHSAATRMAHDPQLSLTDVQWVLGHAHLTTTQLYVTPTQDEVVQAVQDYHARRARRRDDPPPPAPGYDPRSLAVLFGRTLMSVKHKARALPAVANATRAQAQARNSQLRARFPARAVPACWPETTRSLEDTARRLAGPPFLAASSATSAGRRHGVINLLRWLSTFPGESWQQRWLTSGVEEHPGAGWVQPPLAWLAEHGRSTTSEADRLSSGLLMLICGDVIRPGLAWMLTRTHRYLASTMAHARDPDGFARLRQLAAAGAAGARMDGQIAATRIATLLAGKGGRIDEITVGDCVELVDTQRRVQARGGQKKVDFYLRLRALGIFPPDAPATIRAFGLAGGQLSIEELVDRYRLRCTPVRDLIVDYLRERQPALDYASLDATCRTLAGLFWAKIETLAPDIDTIRLPPQIARQWKEDLATKKRTTTTPDGRRVELTRPRLNATDELLRVRAFYLDIAQWAVEEPARWGPWAVPCPIGDAEIGRTKMRQHRKSRMDQRTRERLPVLPVLVRTANERRLAAACRLHAAADTPPGALIPDTDGTLHRAIMATNNINGRSIWAQDTVTGRRRNLTYEEDEAFWAFAAIETLRLTGIRGEELLELTHHSITEYRLPSTGELVPLLQIAPSKTDTERLLLVSPELADVLSAIVSRLRAPNGAIPLVAAYDVRERVWNPPMPLLFQRSVGSEHRAITPTALRKLLLNALAATGLTDAAGAPLAFSPHDFRRIFVTDAILSGLPPHIAQIICGHASIQTTLGYKAIYPAEAIEAHRAFIARRRTTRPGEEYRTPTDEEWDKFLAHFEKRKVSIGTCARTCARAYATPCVHEHACVRYPLLRADPAQRARLEEIRGNLHARIAEAEREGWLGEVEGLKVSLAGAEDKLAQIDTTLRRRTSTIQLGTPTFTDLAGRTPSR